MRAAAVSLVCLLAMAFPPALATAQTATQAPATSFAQLVERGALDEGKDITVTFRYGESAGLMTTDAKVVQLSPSMIVIRVDDIPHGMTSLTVSRAGRDGWRLEVPENRVQSIVRAGVGKSRPVGGMIGGLVGLGVYTVFTGLCIAADECYSHLPGVIALATIGGGTALGVAVSGKSPPEVVYRSATLAAPIGTRLRWSLSPMVGRDRKAALFTIRW
ncbi:MAG: hypothetical protein PVJ49_20775 [Acidobacteriota bacterium]